MIKENTFLKSKLEENIIYFEVLKSSPTLEEWNDCKIIIQNWYKYLELNNKKVGFIFSLENLMYIKPSYLLEWKDIFISLKEKTKKYIIASCIIINYNIIRNFVNLFFKAYDPIKPTCIVKDIIEGTNYIKSYTSK
jgi:hypothetical protein